MKTITLTVNPSDAPAGSLCRIYHRDNNTYLGETVSDGSGVLVAEIPDEAIEEFYIEVAIEGTDGTSEPVVVKVSVE